MKFVVDGSDRLGPCHASLIHGNLAHSRKLSEPYSQVLYFLQATSDSEVSFQTHEMARQCRAGVYECLPGRLASRISLYTSHGAMYMDGYGFVCKSHEVSNVATSVQSKDVRDEGCRDER